MRDQISSVDSPNQMVSCDIGHHSLQSPRRACATLQSTEVTVRLETGRDGGGDSVRGTDRDRALARALVRWFRANARDLPWRDLPLGARRDPYRVLVSELMLQQTQASRVAERFDGFLDRFPTVEALANADEGEVLALWSGLGYYRRARLLCAAARAIVSEHGGRFPESAKALGKLPGLGRYTAGAVASLSFGQRTPAVDANVTRVMLRLEGRELASGNPEAVALSWVRAGALHGAATRTAATPSLLNEALIEFGAVVCTARSPRCLGRSGDGPECPVAEHCRAYAAGTQGCIPTPKRAPARTAIYFSSLLVRDGRGRLAVTRRGSSGLWAGLHEAPTLERTDRFATPAEIGRGLGLPRGRGTLTRLATFASQTSHRECRFEVFVGRCPTEPPESWMFLEPEAVAGLGLATPQRRILLEMGRVGG